MLKDCSNLTQETYATHIKVEPEDEDGVTHDIDDDEGDKDVPLQSRQEVGAVLQEQRDDSVPNTHDTQYNERQQDILVLQVEKPYINNLYCATRRYCYIASVK